MYNATISVKLVRHFGNLRRAGRDIGKLNSEYSYAAQVHSGGEIIDTFSERPHSTLCIDIRNYIASVEREGRKPGEIYVRRCSPIKKPEILSSKRRRPDRGRVVVEEM